MLLRRLFEASYLFSQDAHSQGQWSRSHSVWLAALAVAVIVAVWWWRRLRGRGEPSLAPALTIWAGLLGMAALLLRAQGGPLSARIWALSATVLALGAPLGRWVTQWKWPMVARRSADALAVGLQVDEKPLEWPTQLALMAFHVAALVDLGLREFEAMGWWPAVVAVVCLAASAGGVAWAMRRPVWRSLRVEVLSPLALAYWAAAQRWIVAEVLGVRVDLYEAFAFPNPWAPWFNLRAMLLAGMAWMIVTSGALLWRAMAQRCSSALRRLPGAAAWVGLAIVLAVVVWYGRLVATHLSRGVTASDPYCYLQMAEDLARRGTALHEFPLLALGRKEGLYLWPLVHIGYHPLAEGTRAFTDWPIGWPLLMVPFCWLGGERAMLSAAPCFALLSAVLVCLLAHAMWPGQRGMAWLVGGVAAGITLTSNEGVARSLVPMADAAVQALSIWCLFCLVQARRQDRLLWSALGGAAFALAYFVRHPQILLGLAAAPVLLAPWPWRRRIGHLLTFCLVALGVACPDLFYHWAVRGSPLRSESPEWFLLSWRNMAGAALVAWREGGLARVEFGYLLPLLVLGIWQQWRQREERVWAATMALGFAGVLGFNLFYAALRLRDLISLFPWLALWTGRGIWALWEWASRAGKGASTRRILVLATVAFLVAARTTWVLDMPRYPRLYIFGHVTALEREQYARLAETLPPGAVLAASVNSGALERYTGHQTVRPGSWSGVELARFLAALEARGLPLCLLEDGTEMQQVVSRVASVRQLAVSGRFTLPWFEGGSQWPERLAVLYLVEPERSISKAIP